MYIYIYHHLSFYLGKLKQTSANLSPYDLEPGMAGKSVPWSCILTDSLQSM